MRYDEDRPPELSVDGGVRLRVREPALARDLLVERDYAVEWRTYPIPHSVCPEEVLNIRDWLSRALDSKT